ncbi:MAG: YeeE/YedE family protein [Thermoanaerobacteraceae bacterium]|nr:YeeE/YedE family protein [Thermoanaerobacteraceae bacterium]
MVDKAATAAGRLAYAGQSLKGVWSRLFREPWPLGVGVMAMAITNLFMFMYARALGVFPQMAMWGGWFYNLLGLKTESPFAPYPVQPLYRDMHSLLDVGIILGALGSALLAREFKIRKEDRARYLLGAAGGILMGIGTVVMPPCNVGGFWVATMALSLSGPLSAVGLLLGAYVGGRILQGHIRKAVLKSDFHQAAVGPPVRRQSASSQLIKGILIFIIIFALALAYRFNGMPKHGGLLLFGLVFGLIVQRSRLCFAAAFREILTTRDGTVMKWVLLSMAVGTLGFALLKAQGYQPQHMVFPVGWHNIAGGFVFGIGMVLAGGCGLGILVRSGEGYTRSWLAIITGMLTSGAWVHLYGHRVGEGWLYGRPVYLPEVLGWGGALAFVYGFLLLFYLFILWVEAGKHERA